MKHLVIILDRVTSKRLSGLEMARRLRDAGYRITLLGSGGNYNEIDGIDYLRVDLTMELPAACFSGVWPGVGGIRSWFAAKAQRHSRRKTIVNSVDIDLYRELLMDLSPDLLLIDIEAHNYILPAISLPIPVAVFSVFFNIFSGSEAPPLNTDVIPGLGWRGSRMAIIWLWLRFRIWKWLLYRHQSIRYCGADQLSLLKYYARTCGVRPQDCLDCYHWLIPFVYRRLPLLVLNLHEIDFLSSPPVPVHYVGPMICTDREGLPFLPDLGPISSSLRVLLDAHKRGTSARKYLVYCGFGSFFSSDLNFLEKLITASNDSDWDLVIALGNRLEPEALGSLPENIYCIKFAPQLDFLAAADTAVIHGGLTTVYECIYYRVPMVVYPFAEIDQLGTAARVAKYGLGIVGSRSNDSAIVIRRHIEKVISDKNVKQRIEETRNCLIHHRDENTVAEMVGKLISSDRKCCANLQSISPI
jgi:hypothetical protein